MAQATGGGQTGGRPSDYCLAGYMNWKDRGKTYNKPTQTNKHMNWKGRGCLARTPVLIGL